MSGIVVRKMEEADRPAAMEILSRWNMAPRPPSAEQPEVERSGLDLGRSFVAESGGRVVGVASWIDHGGGLAETASLAVDPSVRGRGIGFLLQEARLAEMRALGIRRVRTETDRPETIRWYVGRFGYRVVGRNPKKHEFSRKDVDHWTVLELEL